VIILRYFDFGNAEGNLGLLQVPLGTLLLLDKRFSSLCRC